MQVYHNMVDSGLHKVFPDVLLNKKRRNDHIGIHRVDQIKAITKKYFYFIMT